MMDVLIFLLVATGWFVGGGMAAYILHAAPFRETDPTFLTAAVLFGGLSLVLVSGIYVTMILHVFIESLVSEDDNDA